MVKINTMSPYTFQKYCAASTEKQLLVSTNCRSNFLLMSSISNDLSDGPSSTSQIDLLEGPSSVGFFRKNWYMMLYERILLKIPPVVPNQW